MKLSWHWAVRVVSLLVFAGAVGLLVNRLHRTPEQRELAHYVEIEIPAILSLEGPIKERIDRLGRAPGLKPEEARTLLVDDTIPRLIRLHKQVAGLTLETATVRALNDEYLAVTDRLTEACRACVRVIDDPKISTLDGMKQVRAEFTAVQAAYQAWNGHVQAACRANRLAPAPR